MSVLQKHINDRKNSDSEFANRYDKGFRNFKIGVLLKQAREKTLV